MPGTNMTSKPVRRLNAAIIGVNEDEDEVVARAAISAIVEQIDDDELLEDAGKELLAAARRDDIADSGLLGDGDD